MASVSLLSSSLLSGTAGARGTSDASVATASASLAPARALPQDTVTISSQSPTLTDAQQAGLSQVTPAAIFSAQIGPLDLTAGSAGSSVPAKATATQALLTTAPPANLSQGAPVNSPPTATQTNNSTLFNQFMAVLNQLNLDPGTLNFLKSLGRMLEQVDPQAFGQLIQGLELLAQSLASHNNGKTSSAAIQNNTNAQELKALSLKVKAADLNGTLAPVGSAATGTRVQRLLSRKRLQETRPGFQVQMPGEGKRRNPLPRNRQYRKPHAPAQCTMAGKHKDCQPKTTPQPRQVLHSYNTE
ncbi:MAG: hypothetical protein WBC04_16735 [Candidatus Acidiferrales bacterium]